MKWVLLSPLVGKEAETGLQKSATDSTVGKHDGRILTVLRKSKAFLFHTTPLPLIGIKTQESHSPILLGLGNPSKGKFTRWKVLFIPKVSHFMLQAVLFSVFLHPGTMRFFFEFSEHSWERNQQGYLNHLPHQLTLSWEALKTM